jgi:hypothetical protein
MDWEDRILIMVRLGQHLNSDDRMWNLAKQNASRENPWFIPEFIERAVQNLTQHFLQEPLLRDWASRFASPREPERIKTVGLVMAGNIPLVGFHDFLCLFVSGHRQRIKASAKDQALIRSIIDWMHGLWPETRELVMLSDQLKGCDAYIASGSNNTARYFDYYFGKYPHVIRRNRTALALLSGEESGEELAGLADDVHLYFGLGCRNVTQICVPANYSFQPLLECFRKYAWLADHGRYRNNYDYQLAILQINQLPYMTNGSLILSENAGLFSPIGVLHYRTYLSIPGLEAEWDGNPDLQCIIGREHLPFGQSQAPGLRDYADGIDLPEWLEQLK